MSHPRCWDAELGYPAQGHGAQDPAQTPKANALLSGIPCTDLG